MRTNYFLGANGFTGRARAHNVETRVFYELATPCQTRNYITPAHAPYREHRTAFPPLTCTSATVSDRIRQKCKEKCHYPQRLAFTRRVLSTFSKFSHLLKLFYNKQKRRQTSSNCLFV